MPFSTLASWFMPNHLDMSNQPTTFTPHHSWPPLQAHMCTYNWYTIFTLVSSLLPVNTSINSNYKILFLSLSLFNLSFSARYKEYFKGWYHVFVCFLFWFFNIEHGVPRNLLDPGFKPRSPTLQADSLLSESSEKPQEYWSRFPFPFPRYLPNPGIEPRSPALQADYLPSELPRKTCSM